MRFSFYQLILICLGISGCHDIKPGVYPEQSEIKKGPGLFTGEQGEFKLLSPSKATSKEMIDAEKETKKAES